MYVIGSGQVVDGEGGLAEALALRERFASLGLRVRRIEIASIRVGWRTELPPGTLRCACAPLTAIEQARTALSQGEFDVLEIHGKDAIRTDFAGRRAERNELMEIYEGTSLLDAYDRLARAFIERHRLSPDHFRELAARLFENYLRTSRRRYPARREPDERWFDPLTSLFRGVDCANPSTDFEGIIQVAPEAVADRCGVSVERRVEVAGCSVCRRGDDDLASIPEVVSYRHLEESYHAACRSAGIEFHRQFVVGRAMLEVYTCYPVVPLAFLLACRFVPEAEALPAFLARHEVTITGGLNLARAPGNNTTLAAMVSMIELMRSDASVRWGGLHSVGALGYLQGFLILGRVAAG